MTLKQPTYQVIVALAVLGVWMVGCRLRQPSVGLVNENNYLATVAREVEYPDLSDPATDRRGTSSKPLSLTSQEPTDYWDLSLEETIQIALTNSDVIRDLGGTVLSAPDTVGTRHDPMLVETNPQTGVENALAAFDAQFALSSAWQKNDRALNNELLGGGTRQLKQDFHSYQVQLSKQTASGTQFNIRQYHDYDSNNQPRNLFPTVWNVNYEAEFRQPLGQGRGLAFNRIAGPNGLPGQLNGVVIARINTDISLHEFEEELRNYVSRVEDAYWNLYYVYRLLDVRVAARDDALAAWRSVSAKRDLPGGVADKEAQAREQYYRFQLEVQNALSGRVGQGVAEGLSVGGGVYVAERDLRLLMGLPLNDGQVIRPNQEPSLAKVVFNWDDVTAEALTRRVELRRQKTRMKRDELELIATRNFMLPRVDAYGVYRWRGFGDRLVNSSNGHARFDNAYADLTGGDFQEWEMGLEMILPIGFRQAHSALRNARLNLTRSQVILEEQERTVVYQLSNALAELDRSYAVVQTAMNRSLAATKQLDVLQEKERVGISVDLNLLLDAQRRKADASRGYFRALADYALAVKNVHLRKGSLMDYAGVGLADGPWEGSYQDQAAQIERANQADPKIDYTLSRAAWDRLAEHLPADDSPPVAEQHPATDVAKAPVAEVVTPASYAAEWISSQQ